MQSFLYILFSEKLNKYYIGSTTDLVRRIDEHNRGKEKFTSTGTPWILVHKEIFEDIREARKREFYIKRMKSKVFIQKLINSTK